MAGDDVGRLTNILVNSIGVLAKLWKLVGVEGKLFLQFGDVRRIFIEQNSAIAGFEAIQSLLGLRPDFRWSYSPDGRLYNDLPEVFVFVTQEDDCSSGL